MLHACSSTAVGDVVTSSRENKPYLPASMLREVIDLQFRLKMRLICLWLVAARLCPHTGHLRLRECLRDWRNCHASLQAKGRVSTECTGSEYATAARKLPFSSIVSSIGSISQPLCRISAVSRYCSRRACLLGELVGGRLGDRCKGQRRIGVRRRRDGLLDGGVLRHARRNLLRQARLLHCILVHALHSAQGGLVDTLSSWAALRRLLPLLCLPQCPAWSRLSAQSSI